MAREKSILIKILAKRLVDKMVVELSWADVVGVMTALSLEEREEFARRVGASGDNGKTAGIYLRGLMVSDAQKRALVEINEMLVDDLLTLADLDTLL